MNREDEPPAKTWKKPPKVKLNIPDEAQSKRMVETHKKHQKARGIICKCQHCRPSAEDTPLFT